MSGQFYETIWATIDLPSLLADLGLDARRAGNAYAVDCPACGDKGSAFVYLGKGWLTCNHRNTCGLSKGLAEVCGDKWGMDAGAVFVALAERAGVALPEYKGRPEDKVGRAKRLDLMTAAADYFTSLLWAEAGRGTLAYLRDTRGYSDYEVKAMGLGHYPGHAATVAHLAAHADAADTFHQGQDAYAVAIPYRDKAGRVYGFAGREAGKATDPKKKYPHLTKDAGLIAHTPFLLDRLGNEKRVYLFEGYLDALVASVRGLAGAVAIINVNAPEGQLDTLKAYGVEQVVVCLDGDRAGLDAIAGNIAKCRARGLSVFVAPDIPDGMDPDDFIKAKGMDAFRLHLDQARWAAEWTLDRIVQGKDLSLPLQADEVVREIVDFSTTIVNAAERKQYAEAVDAYLGETLGGSLKDAVAKAQAEKDAEADRARTADRLAELKALADAGKMDEVRAGMASLASRGPASAKYPPPSVYTVADFLADSAVVPAPLTSGFPSLDNVGATFQAGTVAVVNAARSHGKTTFLLSLALNMARAHADKTFVFFSYEENRLRLTQKILLGMSGWIGNAKDTRRNFQLFQDHLRLPRERMDAKVQAALDEWAVLGHSLIIVANAYTTSELVGTIKGLHSRHDLGALFVDYVQNVRTDGSDYSRQTELKRISDTLRDHAVTLDLPLIQGCQANQAGDAREAIDIENNANLQLDLRNPKVLAAKGWEDKDIPKPDPADKVEEVCELITKTEGGIPTAPVQVTLSKTREGEIGSKVWLGLQGPVFRLVDLSPTAAPSRAEAVQGELWDGDKHGAER